MEQCRARELYTLRKFGEEKNRTENPQNNVLKSGNLFFVLNFLNTLISANVSLFHPSTIISEKLPISRPNLPKKRDRQKLHTKFGAIGCVQIERESEKKWVHIHIICSFVHFTDTKYYYYYDTGLLQAINLWAQRVFVQRCRIYIGYMLS